MKSKEELNALKEEVVTVNKKLAELSEVELSRVNGGGTIDDGKGAISPDKAVEKDSGNIVISDWNYVDIETTL